MFENANVPFMKPALKKLVPGRSAVSNDENIILEPDVYKIRPSTIVWSEVSQYRANACLVKTNRLPLVVVLEMTKMSFWGLIQTKSVLDGRCRSEACFMQKSAPGVARNNRNTIPGPHLYNN